MLVKSFNTDNNFWEENKNLRIPEVFAFFYKEDKSKKKEDSSKIMWAIALVYDFDSEFFKLPLIDRILLVQNDFLKQPGELLKKEYKELIESYIKLSDTPARRQLRIWNEKMDEKSSFISKTKYKEDTWEMLDKMILNNKAMFAEYSRIMREISEEGSETSIKGDKELSLSDSEEI